LEFLRKAHALTPLFLFWLLRPANAPPSTSTAGYPHYTRGDSRENTLLGQGIGQEEYFMRMLSR
jgi:hypothetical protein